MFVKIRYQDVERDEKRVVRKNVTRLEHCYECDHYGLFASKPEPPAKEETEMNLVLEFNLHGPSGGKRTITFPCSSDTQEVTIFIMNEHGKTIDRYIY